MISSIKFYDGAIEVAPQSIETEIVLTSQNKVVEEVLVKMQIWMEADRVTLVKELPDEEPYSQVDWLPKHRPFPAKLVAIGSTDTPEGESWAFIFEKADRTQFGYRVTLSRSDKRKAKRAKRELRDIGWSGTETRSHMIGQSYRLRPATHKDGGLIVSTQSTSTLRKP